MTRQYSDSIALAARRIVAASAVDITEPVAILPLAKQLMAETGCKIDAAKRHVAKAIRLARHETITSPTWGGRREPAGGRPKMSHNLLASKRGASPIYFTKKDDESVAAAAAAAGVSGTGVVIVETVAGELPRYGGKLKDGKLVTWGPRPWG